MKACWCSTADSSHSKRWCSCARILRERRVARLDQRAESQRAYSFPAVAAASFECTPLRRLVKTTCFEEGSNSGARLSLEQRSVSPSSDPYGPETTWYKIKNRAYTQAEGRWELF